jgi:CheY-like chemotaxis protein
MSTMNVESASIIPVLLFKRSPVPSASRKPRSAAARRQENSKRILVIDDEMNIADSLTEILTDHGYEALACYTGQAAIESARTLCPDLVISDVMMPKLNGVDTVLAIRKICPLARIFLFSGQAGTAEILRAARAAGHQFEFLPKPIHPEQLLKKLLVP